MKKGWLLAAWAAVVLAAALTITAAAADEIKIATFGDSLSAGYGLSEVQGFAPVLQKKLRTHNRKVSVINAAVSGDTSAGGLLRVDWMLRKKPDIVIVEFGANDMFRGVPIPNIEKNLSAMVARILKSGARVLLTGMESPGNYNFVYRYKFRKLYESVADEYDVPFYPFFLEGVALNPQLNLPDGLHPNAAGVQVIVDNITPHVVAIMDDLR